MGAGNRVLELGCLTSSPELVVVNVYGAKESILTAYVGCWAGTTNRIVVLARYGNRFMGLRKGIQI